MIRPPLPIDTRNFASASPSAQPLHGSFLGPRPSALAGDARERAPAANTIGRSEAHAATPQHPQHAAPIAGDGVFIRRPRRDSSGVSPLHRAAAMRALYEATMQSEAAYDDIVARRRPATEANPEVESAWTQITEQMRSIFSTDRVPSLPRTRRSAYLPGVDFDFAVSGGSADDLSGRILGAAALATLVDDTIEAAARAFDHLRSTQSRPPDLEVHPSAWLDSASSIALTSLPVWDESDLAEIGQLSLQTQQDSFADTFAINHSGSVQALKSLVTTLRERAAHDVPAGGLTRDDLDERDWTITYKLPALLLTYALPDLCAQQGALPELSLFAHAYQKPRPNGPLHNLYPSLLPSIYHMLRSEHDHDPVRLQAALPALVNRIAHYVETDAEGAQAFDKALTQTLLQAGHQVQGEVLSETLGAAWRELGLP